MRTLTDQIGDLKQKIQLLQVRRNIFAKQPAEKASEIKSAFDEERKLKAQLQDLEAQYAREQAEAQAQASIKAKIKNLYQTLNHVPNSPARNAATLAEIRKLETQLQESA
jgi:beta-phosphoglucomutase-like phosphatase (HAD superfamily)